MIVRAWNSISISQGIVLVALIASIAITIVFAPEHFYEKLAEWSPTTIAAWIMTVGTAFVAVFVQAKNASRETRVTSAPPPSKPNRESGEVQIGTLVAAFILGILAYSLIPGCGMSPLRAHATGATIVSVALEGSRVALVEATSDAIDRCPEDRGPPRDACLDGIAPHARSASRAWDIARAAFVAWREAIEMAATAEGSSSLLPALGVAAARMLREWSDLRVSLGELGYQLPELPPALADLVIEVTQ
jgi:hypothetical protein